MKQRRIGTGVLIESTESHCLSPVVMGGRDDGERGSVTFPNAYIYA